jgi:5-carboxymethyl-2-hydroxymuconic-semialdehyde dehydrogenase
MIYSLNGERCTSSSRLLVQESDCRRSSGAMVAERAKRIKVGHPLDPATEVGPLIHKTHFDKVLGYVAIGKSDGATLAGRRQVRWAGRGLVVRPTLFTGANNQMRIAQEESSARS